MLTGKGVKQILYSEIEDIGKEKIQADITSSIELSQPYIDKIMSKCIANTIYSVFPNNAISHKNYSNIIIDINDFLNEIRDKSFRFVH